jgi:hypothetical protein
VRSRSRRRCCSTRALLGIDEREAVLVGLLAGAVEALPLHLVDVLAPLVARDE